MTIIDKTKPVFVSGANGYVASWIVKKLLDEGHTVHAAVRNPNDDNKVGHLKEIAKNAKGELKLFKSDLLIPGSYEDAMKDCELVYHTASPFTSNYKDAQKELIEPAVKGTENVLQTASKTPTVKRVVDTSSCAAIYTDAIDTVNAPNGILTEDVWNTTASLSHQPYSYSKTLAEKKAWEIANSQNQWDLISINMSLVLGPPLNPNQTTSESMSILKQMGDGTMKMGAPKMGMGLVDVRDVAEVHYLAGYTPEAKGRYITSAHNSNLLEMATTLLPKYGDKYPLPKKAIPKWLLMIVGPMMNKMMTRKALRNNINIPFNADNSKIKKDLGITFKPMKETMEDSFQVLIDNGFLKSK